jgi:2-hydroxychromene-2-carboxylate isomerase
MSQHVLEFFWDFSSPFAYLASTQMDPLVHRTGATLVERPMLLGAVFRAVGQTDVPLFAFSESKRRYLLTDLQRWADFWRVPFRFPTRFPINSVRPLRAYLALDEAKRSAFRQRAFHALWAEDRDITDDAVLRALLEAEADAILPRLSAPEVKQSLFDATQAAVDAGVFGAPSFRVDGRELFWGQDRLNLVERALSGTPRW